MATRGRKSNSSASNASMLLPDSDKIEFKDKVSLDLLDAIKDTQVINNLVTALSPAIELLITKYVDEKFADLSRSVNVKFDSVHDKLTNMQSENAGLRKRLRDLENYSRRDNLVFSGLKSTSFADAASAPPATSAQLGTSSQIGAASQLGSSSHLGSASSNVITTLPVDNSSITMEDLVITFVKDSLDISISSADIITAHRIGIPASGSSSQHPPPILVRFANRKVRDRVYAARKSLKTSSPGTFINEHLSADTSQLFRRARQLCKQKSIHSAWTSNGTLYIRLSTLPESRPIRVDSLADLPSQ